MIKARRTLALAEERDTSRIGDHRLLCCQATLRGQILTTYSGTRSEVKCVTLALQVQPITISKEL